MDPLYFTTFRPSNFCGYTNYSMAFDNLAVTSVVPELSSYALAAVGVGLSA